jgi:hypothetical protein
MHEGDEKYVENFGQEIWKRAVGNTVLGVIRE